ncbi:MAG: hypothetical protein HOJ48_00065 [Desulfobacula sp.]|jgi:hypothetical protein|nr:hypothetical protein [Desulfobacula sp.]
MKKLLKKTIVLICIYFIFLTGVATAAENSMLVELPKKINLHLGNIAKIAHKYDVQTIQKEGQIKDIIHRLHNANNQDHIYSIQQEYLAHRAESLKGLAHKIVGIENELTSAVKNIIQLDQLRNDSHKFGIGEGIERNDLEAKQAVKGMLKGFESVLHMVEALNPEVNLSNQYDTFSVMNSMARSFYTNSSNISMESQKKFILEALSLSKSIQGLLGSEHDYLLRRLYYIDSNHIVRQFGKIKLAILGNGLDIKNVLEKHHITDEMVLNHGNSNTILKQENYNTRLNKANYDY